jgi:hypothetical protein
MPTSYRNSETAAPVMQGTPVPPEWRIPPAGYDTPPFNRWTFQNMRQGLVRGFCQMNLA